MGHREAASHSAAHQHTPASEPGTTDPTGTVVATAPTPAPEPVAPEPVAIPDVPVPDLPEPDLTVGELAPDTVDEPPEVGRLRGYRALVTGAGRGIGEAIAVRLAAEGARVLVTDRDEASARAVAATIRADGGWARGEVCDVRDREAVDEVVRRAGAQLGGLELLVNNAFDGDPDPGSLIEETDEQWAKNLDVTLYGALRCCRAALPYLLLAEGRGSVVNIGSVNAAMDFGQHAYSAAKAGLESFTRTLAGQYAAQGVRVNLVAPGTVHTPNWIGRQEALERAAEHYPLGRVGRPEDIAAAVAFLASEDAAWITGISLPVDGGLSVSNLGLKRALSD